MLRTASRTRGLTRDSHRGLTGVRTDRLPQHSSGDACDCTGGEELSLQPPRASPAGVRRQSPFEHGGREVRPRPRARPAARRLIARRRGAHRLRRRRPPDPISREESCFTATVSPPLADREEAGRNLWMNWDVREGRQLKWPSATVSDVGFTRARGAVRDLGRPGRTVSWSHSCVSAALNWPRFPHHGPAGAARSAKKYAPMVKTSIPARSCIEYVTFISSLMRRDGSRFSSAVSIM